jgi:predicted phosphoribosyltransferase
MGFFGRAHAEAPFANRQAAGVALGARLQDYAGRPDVVVLGLARGGVPVAVEVARALGAPVDVFVVRKLGVPGHRELAMGAIASGGIRVLNDDVVSALGIPTPAIEAVAAEEALELARRERAYRDDRTPMPLEGRIVVVVDDGLATGSTMRAAVRAIRDLRPARIVVAVPVGAGETCDELGREADEVVCLRTPVPFAAVGQWYEDFSETSDEEVRSLLAAYAAARVSRGVH